MRLLVLSIGYFYSFIFIGRPVLVSVACFSYILYRYDDFYFLIYFFTNQKKFFKKIAIFLVS